MREGRARARPSLLSRVILYDSPVSGNCYKVRLLLAHLGIPYERRAMDVVDRSNRREVLGESNAILWYFAEGTRFVPDDRYERAQVLQWMFYEQYELEPALAVVRFWVAYSGRPEGLSAERREELTKAGHRVLSALERHVTGREFFVGNRITLADISLYAYTHVAPEGGFELEPYPSVRAWLDRVAAEPGHVPIEA